jgi:hypothetical protein
MKRHGNLFSRICDMSNLEEALRRAARGKRWQKAVQNVENDRERHLAKLQEMLVSHRFTTAEYRQKYIYEPKKRLISILPFYPDRIVQHAVMLVLEPIWDALMIDTSFACRRGKGQHAASNVCRQYARNHEFCVQCDISKFYPSINHGTLKGILRRKLKDRDVLWLLDDVIDSVEGEVNVPIGNYLSQWFGNLYMNELDMYVKHELKAKAYERYCDDFLFFGNDKEELRRIADKAEAFCNSRLGLVLSRKNLFHTFQGVDFVGYRHFSSGMVLVRKRTAYRIRRKLRKLPVMLAAGRIDREKARSVVASAYGWLKHADTYNLRERIGLWRLEGMVNIA